MNRITCFFVVFSFLLLLFSSASIAQEEKPFPAFLEFLISFDGNGFDKTCDNSGIWPYEVTDTYDTNVTFKGTGTSQGDTEVEEVSLKMATLGWQFPRGKGKVIVSYYDFKEETSDTVIDHKLLINGQLVPDEWYDPNGDWDYSDGAINYYVKLLDEDLGMETQVFDAAFTKDFAKEKKIGGSWNAGLRWAKHEQTLPMGYYYAYIDPSNPSFYMPLFSPTPLLISQKSESMGVKGGGRILYNLFKKRLVLSAGVDISMTFGQNEIPTHYYKRVKDIDQDGSIEPTDVEYFPFSEKRDKSYWFDMFDFNAKFRIFRELYLFGGYRLAHFRDVFLSPNIVELPTAKDVAPNGMYISYTSEDISYGVPYVGLSYQF